MDFYERFKEVYPENLDKDGKVLTIENEGNKKYLNYNVNLRENILFTATYGKHLFNIDYSGIIVEDKVQNGRTDITIKDLNNKVFGVIENGICTSKNPKDTIYKKIIQSLNYLLSYSLEGKLNTSDKIHITVNLYNPDIFLNKKKNFSAYMDSKTSSYKKLFNTYGIFSVTYMFSQKKLQELFMEMSYEKKQVDFIYNKENYFLLDDQINALQYTYFSGGKAIPNNFSSIRKDDFSYNYDNIIENRFAINGLPFTSFKRGEHFNSRAIHENEVYKKKVEILNSSLFRYVEINRQINNPELYKIGWNPREIVADDYNTEVFISEDFSKVLVASESSEIGNGQTTSTAILEIKEMANLDLETFKSELSLLISTKELFFDSHFEQIQSFLQKMMPKVNISVHNLPWNARLNMEINNNVQEQSSHDKESYKHKEIIKKVISKIYESNSPLLNDLHLTISKSFSQDPRYKSTGFKSKDFSDLNILISSYFEGQRIHKFFNKELKDIRNKLKERTDLNYNTFNETHITLGRHILKNSANSKMFRKKGFEVIRNNFVNEELNLKKILIELNEKINILNIEKYDISEFKSFQNSFLLTLEKHAKKKKKNSKLLNFIYVVSSFFKMNPRVDAYEEIRSQLLDLIEIDVEVDSILSFLEIDLYIDSLDAKDYSKFSNKDSFKTFIGILMGLNNYNINSSEGISLVNRAIESFKKVKELSFTSVRHKNINDYTQKEIYQLEELFLDLLEYKKDVIEEIKNTSSNKLLVQYAKEIVYLKINSENLGGLRINKILKDKYNINIPSTTINDNLNKYKSEFSTKK